MLRIEWSGDPDGESDRSPFDFNKQEHKYTRRHERRRLDNQGRYAPLNPTLAAAACLLMSRSGKT